MAHLLIQKFLIQFHVWSVSDRRSYFELDKQKLSSGLTPLAVGERSLGYRGQLGCELRPYTGHKLTH